MAQKGGGTTGKPRAKKVVAAEGAPVRKIAASGMTPAKKLNDLLKDSRAAYKEQRGISGTIGAAIKEAVEHDHLHKKAFASVKAADRMEPEELADYFAHRDHYEDVSGLRRRAGSVMRMPLGEEKAGGQTEEPGRRAANVKAFPLPQGQAAE